MPDGHPSLVNPNQTSRKYDGWNEKTRGEHHSPQSWTFSAKNERPKTDQSKYATNGKTERPQLFICDVAWHCLFSEQKAVSGEQFNPTVSSNPTKNDGLKNLKWPARCRR